MDRRAAPPRGRYARFIRTIAVRPGPAVCEQLALCYWAGKSLQIDPLNFAFGVEAGSKQLQPVLDRVVAHDYATIFIRSKAANYVFPGEIRRDGSVLLSARREITGALRHALTGMIRFRYERTPSGISGPKCFFAQLSGVLSAGR